MNINFNVYNSYVKSQDFGSYGKENETASGKQMDAKQDKVSFSADAAAYRAFDKQVKATAAEVEQAGGSAKLAALRASIQAGTYSVSSADLADAILNRIA